MGIITKEVEIKLNSYNVSYYENLGYKIPLKKATESTRKKYKKDYVYDYKVPIVVKIEDLQNGSHAKIKVLCDYCKKNIITMSYKDYRNRMKITDKHACVDCSHLKLRDSVLSIYNVENVSQSDEVKKKIVSTNIKKYGSIAPAQNKDVMTKMKESFLLNYGVENPMQSLEIREKANKTLCKNGNIRTSKQQIYLCNLYDGKINFPIKYYPVDICLPEEKLVIEYDGAGHRLRVVLGSLTQEEFNKKEIIRNAIIKKEGYKQMRIISSKDKLPPDSILLQMLQDTRNYFSNYPNHSWIEFNISTSTVHNAEYKYGIPYDYGELRTITNQTNQAN